GETALAGVSLVFPLTQIRVGLGSLIGVGAGSVLSIAIGRQDLNTQQRLLGNVNFLSLATTVVYLVLGLFFSTQLVKLMGGEGQVLILGDVYFRITVIGSLFWIYGLASNMIVRAEGKMKSAAVIMGIGLVADIVANYFLVVVLALGVEGAAWAANIGMAVYTLLGWFYFSKDYSTFASKTFSLYWDSNTVKLILNLGMPSLIMVIMTLVQGIVIFNTLVQYGTVIDIAFYGVIFRIFMFTLTPIFGLMRALQPVIGINFGAGKYERVISFYKVFAITAMLLTLPFWIVSMTTPEFVLHFMLPEQSFTGTQLMYFRIYMALLPLLSLIFMAMTLFPAVGKGKPAAMIGIARQLILSVPVMLVLPRIIGVSGIYVGSLAIDVIILLWTVVMVKEEFAMLRTLKII
ncbi:MAG: MATE family efflux transporter, partial [Sporomusa sp.]